MGVIGIFVEYKGMGVYDPVTERVQAMRKIVRVRAAKRFIEVSLPNSHTFVWFRKTDNQGIMPHRFRQDLFLEVYTNV